MNCKDLSTTELLSLFDAYSIAVEGFYGVINRPNCSEEVDALLAAECDRIHFKTGAIAEELASRHHESGGQNGRQIVLALLSAGLPCPPWAVNVVSAAA